MPLNLFDVEEELFGTPPDTPILPEVNFNEELLGPYLLLLKCQTK